MEIIYKHIYFGQTGFNSEIEIEAELEKEARDGWECICIQKKFSQWIIWYKKIKK